jgi:CxxC motif-containing protein (DUF1111 family)
LSHLTYPYPDMLLHDMGDVFSDHRREGEASGSEGRTAPLWGIGLTGIVDGHTLSLHDGRECNIAEAVVWRGGETQASRDKFVALSKADGDRLVVNSL